VDSSLPLPSLEREPCSDELDPPDDASSCVARGARFGASSVLDEPEDELLEELPPVLPAPP
jgi:hypothetical protein